MKVGKRLIKTQPVVQPSMMIREAVIVSYEGGMEGLASNPITTRLFCFPDVLGAALGEGGG